MAVTSTNDFNLNIAEVVEEAYERLGGEPVIGNEPKTARRSLNLLFQELQNRGINLWTIEQVQVTCSTSTNEYTLASNTVDWLDAVITRSSTDYPMERMTYAEYLGIPNKQQTGRAFKFFIRRDRDAPSVVVWPRADNTTDIIKAWKVRQIYDAGNPANNPDVPRRFLPVVTAGLAYYLSFKRKPKNIELELAEREALFAEFNRQFELAQEEDRERADFSVAPRVPRSYQ